MVTREQGLRNAMRGVNMMWIALVLSQLPYVAVGWMLVDGREVDAVPETSILVYVAVAAAMLGAAIVMRRVLFAGKLERIERDKVIPSLLTATLVSVALAEGVALTGLVRVWSGGTFLEQLLFAAVGLVGSLACYPDVRKSVLMWEQATGQTWKPVQVN